MHTARCYLPLVDESNSIPHTDQPNSNINIPPEPTRPGQQLPLALQAVLPQGRLQEEAEPLHRGRRRGPAGREDQPAHQVRALSADGSGVGFGGGGGRLLFLTFCEGRGGVDLRRCRRRRCRGRVELGLGWIAPGVVGGRGGRCGL